VYLAHILEEMKFLRTNFAPTDLLRRSPRMR